jgi:hypothetical protein
MSHTEEAKARLMRGLAQALASSLKQFGEIHYSNAEFQIAAQTLFDQMFAPTKAAQPKGRGSHKERRALALAQKSTAALALGGATKHEGASAFSLMAACPRLKARGPRKGKALARGPRLLVTKVKARVTKVKAKGAEKAATPGAVFV